MDNPANPQPDKCFVAIKKQLRKEVGFGYEYEERGVDDVIIKTVKRSQLYESSAVSRHDYTDLPSHWKYLGDTLLLNKFPYKNKTEIVIVEKYKNVAIGYNFAFTNRPFALYRDCCKYFKSLKVGDVLSVKLRKMYVHVEKVTLIFTDLYATADSPYAFTFFGFETRVSRRLLKIINFTIKIPLVHEIDKCCVLFTDFGAVLIPRKFRKVLEHDGSSNFSLTGDLKYSMIGISKYRFVCWKLDDKNFTVYKNNIPHARVINGELQIIPPEEKFKRIGFATGRKTCQMVEMHASEKKPPAPINFDLDFLEFGKFISLDPARKRTIVRKI